MFFASYISKQAFLKSDAKGAAIHLVGHVFAWMNEVRSRAIVASRRRTLPETHHFDTAGAPFGTS